MPREVGINYLSDLNAMRPVMLWRSIWAKDETKFTQTIIKDGLKLDNSLRIPWLNNIVHLYNELFRSRSMKILSMY